MADLKPMELGEILDGALTIFRRHFGLFVKIGIAALWLPVALTIYVQLAGGKEQHIVLTLLITLIQYFAGLFLTASAIRVISDSYLGRDPQLGDALSLGASKIWSLFVVGLGKGIILGLIAVLVGIVAALAIPAMQGAGAVGVLFTIALFLGGCWFFVFVACGYAVTTPVVVLENLGGAFDAFGRSWELTRTFKRKIAGIAIVTWLIVYVPIIAFSMLGAYFMLESPVIGQTFDVVTAAMPVVMTPITSCVWTLLYYDLRVRREAFDLQILSQQLGIS
ncbi:MAG TPA: hypothetical protein VGQ06_15125 [Gemmatimonadales bacterium]|jgi:hypothetical protein|nr:hypothetical protein [Gemmatimonadales bacterium]